MGTADSTASAGKTNTGANWWEFLKLVITPLLVALIPSMMSLYVAKQAREDARNARLVTDQTQANLVESDDKTKARFKDSEENIRKLLFKYNDFHRLEKVSGRFKRPEPNDRVDDNAKIACEGEFEAMSDDLHLWLAVEVDGLIFFKPEFSVPGLPNDGTTADGTWSTEISEPREAGHEKVFSLRLYAATEEGHYQIRRWLKSGKYRGIPWMSNTRLLHQVPGAVAVGSHGPVHAAVGAASAPVRGARLLCAGPELMGVPGVHDLPVGVRVAAAAAPQPALADTEPVGTRGSLTLTGMPGGALGQPGSARGPLVTTDLSTAQGAVVAGTQSLAPGLAATQSWLVTSGDQRSLGSAPCTPPGADLWLVAGGSAAGRQERLVLTNPGGNPVSVDVTLHGPHGPVDTAIGKGIVVAPHGRTSFLLDSISGAVASPAVHVVTQGGVVSAVLNDTWLNGTTPAGSDDASPSAPPSRDQVVPGVDVRGGHAVLRVVVPGPGEAVVQARVLTSNGPRGLPSGAVTRVPGGSVRDIDISGLPAGASGLQVRADVPVVASASFQRNGTKSSDFAWAVSTDPITGVAGMPFAQTTALQHTVWLTASAGSVVADVLAVGQSGTVTTQRVTVPADAAIAVAVPSAGKVSQPTSVWVRRVSGSGQLRGAVDSSVKDARGVLVTSTPLLDSALRTTTVGVRAVPN